MLAADVGLGLTTGRCDLLSPFDFIGRMPGDPLFHETLLDVLVLADPQQGVQVRSRAVLLAILAFFDVSFRAHPVIPSI